MRTWAAVEARPARAIMFNGVLARLNPGVPFTVAAASIG